MITTRFLSCLVCTSVFSGYATAAELTPDLRVLADIDTVAVRLGSGITQRDALAEIQKLEQQHTNSVFLLEQIMCYMAFGGAYTEERGYGGMALMSKLDIDAATKIKAVVPYLDASDVRASEIASHVLRSVDKDKSLDKGVAFGAYESILKKTPAQPPAALIRYMYDRNAQAAVLSMAHVYGDKATEAELADTLKGEPKAALQSLADRSEWWARLYVAETMKKQPQLRDATLLKKLEKDDNSLVKEKIAELTAGR